MMPFRSVPVRLVLALVLANICSRVDAQAPLELTISAGLVRSLSRPVDDARPIYVCVMGFDVFGKPRLTGFAEMALVPSMERGVVRMTLEGSSVGCGLGTRSWLNLHTLDRARVFAQVDYTFDGKVIEGGSTLVRTCAVTELQGVETGLRPLPGLFVRGVVKAGFRITQERNNCVASQVSKQILEQQIALDLLTLLALTNKNYREEVLEPLYKLGVSAENLRCSSTTESMFLRANVPELSISTVPPASGPADARLSLHQELLNRNVLKKYAGRTLTMKEIEKQVKQLADLFKFQLAEQTDENDLSITLNQEAPITIRFDKGQVVLVMRGEEYTSGNTSYPPMNVTSRWDFDISGGNLRLLRRPQLEIYPPDFVPGSGVRLPFRLQTLRNMLNRRFSRLLPLELDFTKLDRPDFLRGEVGVRISRVIAESDWLVINWHRTK